MIDTSKSEIPDFRHNALEEEFCEKLTTVVDIFKTYGELIEHYDIRQMIKTLKIHNWSNIRPFQHFLTPLFEQINVVRDTLTKMHFDGPLRIKYVVEENKQLKQ